MKMLNAQRKLIAKYHEDPFFYSLLFFLFAGFLLYLKSFGCNWSYDDFFVVLGNKDILSINQFIENSYPGRPMRELSYMLDYSLFNFVSPYWHIQNILWHSLNTWLVFVLSMNLSDDKRVAWMASLMFLIHPVQVEVVAQVSHRKDSLSLFFILISFILYLNYRKSAKLSYLLMSFFSFVLASLSKENALILPLFIVLFELIYGEKYFERSLLRFKLLLFFLACVLTVSFLSFDSSSYFSKANALLVSNNYYEDFQLSTYLIALLNAWGFLFAKLILPLNLSVNYVLEVPESLLVVRVLAVLCVLCFASAYFCFAKSKRPYLTFSILWLAVLYLPTSNLYPLNHLAADRYLYAPSVGFFMLLAYLFNRMNSKIIPAVFVGIVITWSIMTTKQISVWENNLTLWQKSLSVNPMSARATSNVGRLLYSDSDEQNLLVQKKASSINPYDPLIHIEIGRILERRGEMPVAQKHYSEAKKLYNPQMHGMYQELFQEVNIDVNEVVD